MFTVTVDGVEYQYSTAQDAETAARMHYGDSLAGVQVTQQSSVANGREVEDFYANPPIIFF